MRPELELYQLIDKYHNGLLEGEVLSDFVHKMETDKEFFDEVSHQALINEIVIGSNFNLLRSQISNDLVEIDKLNKYKKWGSILFATILIGAGSFYFVADSNKLKEKSVLKTMDSKPETKVLNSEIDTLNNDQVVVIVESKNTEIKTGIIEKNNIEVKPLLEAPVYKISIVSDNQVINDVVKGSDQPKIITIDKIEKKKEVTNPCQGVLIKCESKIIDACNDKNDGKIKILQDKIVGGKAPYTISTSAKNATVTKEVISGLSAGSYEVLIVDENGCNQKVNFDIKEKFCNAKSHNISPDRGEVWKYIGLVDQYFKVTILTQSGRLVFQKTDQIGEIEWDGLVQNGENAASGLYLYLIEYANGEKDNGQITISR